MTVGAVLIFLLGKNKVITPFADDYILRPMVILKMNFLFIFL